MSHLVFVYGSLKAGYHNHNTLANSPLISTGTTEPNYQMISFGSFPALIEGDKAYEGEIYEVDNNTLQQLDYLEGYPDFYNRSQVDIELPNGDVQKCWVYVLANPGEYPINNGSYVDRSSW